MRTNLNLNLFLLQCNQVYTVTALHKCWQEDKKNLIFDDIQSCRRLQHSILLPEMRSHYLEQLKVLMSFNWIHFSEETPRDLVPRLRSHHIITGVRNYSSLISHNISIGFPVKELCPLQDVNVKQQLKGGVNPEINFPLIEIKHLPDET